MIAAIGMSPAKTMTIMQTVSEAPMENAKESCVGEVRSLDHTTSQKACLLSSGRDGRGSEMKDYFVDKLRSFDKS